MEIHPLSKFWSLIYSILSEFWALSMSKVEDAAIQNDVPIELYLYSELGLEYFSTEDFRRRDPFSNPEIFERQFARLDVKGWIEPLPGGKYRVTEKARHAVRQIIQAGDAQFADFALMSAEDMERLVVLLKRIARENELAPEPPQKWAIFKRFRTAHAQSPWILQAREYLMDLFAYRDDSHLTAARPHFGEGGIVWLVLGSLWNGQALTAQRMAEIMENRGYDVEEFEVALQAAVELGWAESSEAPQEFRLTLKGKELWEEVEKLTNEYFFPPLVCVDAKRT